MKYAHNALVLVRTLLRIVVIGPLMLFAELGRTADDLMGLLNHRFPGLERWQK